MLTGRPPFQSTTQEEIYRKARKREYDWPKLNTSENSICQEAKDLVSILLQSPEDRPDPDAIVQHAFFSSGYVPSQDEMTPKLRDSAPGPHQFIAPGKRSGRANVYTKNLKKLCIQSDVGPFNQSQKIHSSTYKEVSAEERAGLTPAVPLPEGIVYRPFDEWLKEQVQRLKDEAELSSGTTSQVEAAQPFLLQSSSRLAPTTARAGQQSFAAQQRAQHQPASAESRAHKSRSIQQEKELDPKHNSPAESLRKAQFDMGIPMRLTKSYDRLKEDPATKVVSTEAVSTEIVSTEGRIGVDLVQQLNQANRARRSNEEVRYTTIKHALSIFSPKEHPELLPKTGPDQILKNLRSFHAELKRALNSRSIASNAIPPETKTAIVVKWVDYTNKFGLGYILSNGSVGCIFKSSLATSGYTTGRIPPTCVIVRDAERHLQNRGKESYIDRHQLVPVSGAPIEFYENRGEEGISRGKVSPGKFEVIAGKNGAPGKLSRSIDEFDDRKCEKIILWNKFAKYMTAFGRDQDYPYDDALQRISQDSDSKTVVAFYQRFGDVGCWGFSDGSFQVSLECYSPCEVYGN